jgi:hypothetical protein
MRVSPRPFFVFRVFLMMCFRAVPARISSALPHPIGPVRHPGRFGAEACQPRDRPSARGYLWRPLGERGTAENVAAGPHGGDKPRASDAGFLGRARATEWADGSEWRFPRNDSLSRRPVRSGIEFSSPLQFGGRGRERGGAVGRKFDARRRACRRSVTSLCAPCCRLASLLSRAVCGRGAGGEGPRGSRRNSPPDPSSTRSRAILAVPSAGLDRTPVHLWPALPVRSAIQRARRA